MLGPNALRVYWLTLIATGGALLSARFLEPVTKLPDRHTPVPNAVSLGDCFALVLWLSIGLAIATRWMHGAALSRPLLAWVPWLAVAAICCGIWWRLIQTLNRKGVRDARRRFVFLGVLPPSLALALAAIPNALLLITDADQRQFAWRAAAGLSHVAGLAVVVAASRRAAVWVARGADMDAGNHANDRVGDFRAIEETEGPSVRTLMIARGDSLLSYNAFLEKLEHSEAFREFFSKWLRDSPLAAFRWETPPLTTTCLDRPFECALLSAPELRRRPDTKTFEHHFDEDTPVAVFSNLGGDATLVVPTPQSATNDYAHLANFVRSAPSAQQHALWVAVAAAMRRRISDRSVWLSTAGAGVAWLHVRLDDRPKYYGYERFRASPPA